MGAPAGVLSAPGHFWLPEAEAHSSFLREKGVYWEDKHAQKPRCQEFRPSLGTSYSFIAF